MGYKLIYDSYGMFGFKTEKDEYDPGELVRVKYIGMGTDQCYTFDVNADDVKTVRNDFVADITFTMPDHDVELECSSSSMWSPSPAPGFGMGTPLDSFQSMLKSQPVEQNQNEPKASDPANGKGWTCPNCGAVNMGRFCAECGTPKPDN